MKRCFCYLLTLVLGSLAVGGLVFALLRTDVLTLTAATPTALFFFAATAAAGLGGLLAYLLGGPAGRPHAGPGGRLALLRGGLRCGRPGGAADGADYRPLHRLRRGAPHRRGALLRLPGPDGRRHPLLFAAVCHDPLHL